MREIRGSSGRKRQKKRAGCCLGYLLIFTIIIGGIGFLGYHLINKFDVKNYFLKAKYPIRYQEFVEKYAEEFELDEALVYAVILSESKFDTYAESKVGAKGLMQLTDETGADCAKKVGLENYSGDQLFDPEINIRLGCYYLKRLIQDYDGITETAIAAYNGGPGNVDKWLGDPKYSSGDGVLQEIPFKETRDYVKKVTEAYWNYQSIYHLDKGVSEDGKEERIDL